MPRKALLTCAIALLCLAFLVLLPQAYLPFWGVSSALITLPTRGSAFDLEAPTVGHVLTTSVIPALVITLIGFILGIGIFKLFKLLKNEPTKLNPKSVAAAALTFFGIGWLIVPNPITVAVIVIGMVPRVEPNYDWFRFNTEWTFLNPYVNWSYTILWAFGPSILMLFSAIQYWKPRVSKEQRATIAALLALAGGVWLLLALLFFAWDFVSLPRHLSSRPLSIEESINFWMQFTVFALLALVTPIGILKYAHHLFRFRTPAELQRQNEIEAVYKLED